MARLRPRRRRVARRRLPTALLKVGGFVEVVGRFVRVQAINAGASVETKKG